MRKEFVQTENRKEAERECPWAEKIVKVVGGYQCFESQTDYDIWANQR